MKFVQLAAGVSAVFTSLIGNSTLAASMDVAAFGTFGNIAAGSEAAISFYNNDHVTESAVLWGRTGAPYSSMLGFDGLGSLHKPAFVTTEIGTPFRIGLFGWRNGTPGNDKTNVSNVQFQLSVHLGIDQVSDFVFGISIDNTSDEDPKGTPDHLKLVSNFERYQFAFEGSAYSLDFRGFSFDDGRTFTNKLAVPENDGVKAGLYAVINSHSPLPSPTPQAVPLPAAVWLLGSGLAALAGTLGRRKRAYAGL